MISSLMFLMSWLLALNYIDTINLSTIQNWVEKVHAFLRKRGHVLELLSVSPEHVYFLSDVGCFIASIRKL